MQPVASRESFVPGHENGRGNGNTNPCDDVDAIICSRSSQDKRFRKTSTVCFRFFAEEKLKFSSLPASGAC